MLPWSLYNLTARDQGSPLIRPFHEWQSATVGVGTITWNLNFEIPPDQYLLVSHINVWIAGQPVDQSLGVGYNVLDLPGQTHQQVRSWRSGNQNVTHHSFSWTGAPLMLVNSKQRIDCYGFMISAANTWTMNANVAGVLIPRGTLALT